MDEANNEKKGLAIAAIVLGGVALLWTLLSLVMYQEVINEILLDDAVATLANGGIATSMVLFQSIAVIIGSILAAISIAKKKTTLTLAAVITNAVAVASIILLVILTLNYLS